MGATVFEIAGGSARPPPPLVKGVGTKMLGKGRVKILLRVKIFVTNYRFITEIHLAWHKPEIKVIAKIVLVNDSGGLEPTPCTTLYS